MTDLTIINPAGSSGKIDCMMQLINMPHGAGPVHKDGYYFQVMPGSQEKKGRVTSDPARMIQLKGY